MNIAWLAALAAALIIPGFIRACLDDLISEEVRGRLERLPGAIIELAVRRVPVSVREGLREEWAAELSAIQGGHDGLPVTRLFRGIRFALGLLRSAGSIGRTVTPRHQPRWWLLSAFRLPQYWDPQADELVTGFGAGKLDVDLLVNHVLTLKSGSRERRRYADPVMPLRAAAVEGLSASQTAELAVSMWKSDLQGDGLRLLWAWLQPERIRKRQPEDAAAILGRLLEHGPGDRDRFEQFLTSAITHWSVDKRQKAEELLHQVADPPVLGD